MKSLRKPVSANEEDALWTPRENGPSRRQLIRLLSAGGASAVFGASLGSHVHMTWAQGTAGGTVAAYRRNFVKDTTQNFYYPSATIAASRWWEFTTDVIPYERLFIRNRHQTPIVDKTAWTLRVTGGRDRAAHGAPLRRPHEDAQRDRRPLP